MNIRRLAKMSGILVLAIAITAGALYYVPLDMFSVQQKPEQPKQKLYDHYTIIEEDTGEILMYVPLVVSVDDELISENNKRYRIVKVVANQAYARFVEDLDLDPNRRQDDQSNQQ